eukprot:GHVU01177590.1.p1 GENE.GHVU01177590.1~~GHVU01177590.1.p1  ORF type:complete len:103 (-),score=5.43 GHVU01177590.1:88-396(-)
MCHSRHSVSGHTPERTHKHRGERGRRGWMQTDRHRARGRGVGGYRMESDINTGASDAALHPWQQHGVCLAVAALESGSGVCHGGGSVAVDLLGEAVPFTSKS